LSLLLQFTTKRTWTFEDVCKNDLSETQTIEVNDDEAPQFISFPEDKSLTCQDPCASNLLLSSECTGTPTSTDNCDGTIIPTKVDVSEDLATGTGVTITRTWTATDVCGNPNSKDQTIVVEDACRFTVSDAFSGKSVNVLVNVINVEGGVEISVSVPKDVAGECTGDIRGVFFEVAGGADRLDDIVISGDHVTSKKIGEGEIDRVANDVLMKGGGQNANKFDVSTLLLLLLLLLFRMMMTAVFIEEKQSILLILSSTLLLTSIIGGRGNRNTGHQQGRYL
jgi:hypothetical protein